MNDNLAKRRPPGWNESKLFNFIEEAWSNSIAVFANKGLPCQRLSEIDAFFDELHQSLKLTSQQELVPALLFLRSFVAFRASIFVLLPLPTDGYPLLRSCLECAGYAALISTDIALAEAWLKRDDSPETKGVVRDRFTERKIVAVIAAKDSRLAEIYRELYQRTIDWGAHPNEKAMTAALVPDTVHSDTKNVQFKMLGEDGLPLDHALKVAAQVAVCVLKVFGLTLKQFQTEDVRRRVVDLGSGL